MTAEQMIAEIEGYYGKYPADAPSLRPYVLQYLRNEYTDKQRDRLWKGLMLFQSREYRTVPDIALIRLAWLKVTAEVEYPEFKSLPEPGQTYLTKEEQADLWGEVAELVRAKTAQATDHADAQAKGATT